MFGSNLGKVWVVDRDIDSMRLAIKKTLKGRGKPCAPMFENFYNKMP